VLEGERKTLRRMEDDNERITRKFTMELEKAVREMKTNTVPGRDGLTVSFCKEF